MIDVAVAVVAVGPLVLVGRRSRTAAAAAGRLEFPGGKVEPGETPAGAAARECLEETGVAVAIGDVLDVGDDAVGGVRVHFFAAVPRSGQPAPRSPFAWMPMATLDPAEFPAANARVLARLAGVAATTGQGGS